MGDSHVEAGGDRNGPDAATLYGRDQLLEELLVEIKQGARHVGVEGLTGSGKSAILDALADRLDGARQDSIVVRVNAAEFTSEPLAVQTIYEQLKYTRRDASAVAASIKARLGANAPPVLRALGAAVAADIAKYFAEKAEHTIAAVEKIAAGEDGATSVPDALSKLESSNLRYFVRSFLQGIADADVQIVLCIDSVDSADASLLLFIRYLIGLQIEGFLLLLAHNTEKGPNESWNHICADIGAQGGNVTTLKGIDRGAIARWGFDVTGQELGDDRIDELASVTGGRAFDLKVAIEAIRDGKLPRQRNYEGYIALAREGLDQDARTVAELLSLLADDAVINVDLLARAASAMGVVNIAPALDQLRSVRFIEERSRLAALKHSLLASSTRQTLTEPRLIKLIESWNAAIMHGGGNYASPDVIGLLPALMPMLMRTRNQPELIELGGGLVRLGRSSIGLQLLDRVWSGKMDRVAEERAALLAAEARLDLGLYDDVPASLKFAAGSTNEDVLTSVSLLNLKLALRTNQYPQLWRLAEELAARQLGVDAQVEMYLISNTAYRDILDESGIRATVEKLKGLRGAAAKAENQIDRSLARSFAKLGRYDDALNYAHQAVDEAFTKGSIRDLGNSYLARAEAERYAGNGKRAISDYSDAIRLAEDTGNRDLLLWSLLGLSAIHLTLQDLSSATPLLTKLGQLLNEPGYRHPLEIAHWHLLRYFAGISAKNEALEAYAALGIEWPSASIERYEQTGLLGHAIPL